MQRLKVYKDYDDHDLEGRGNIQNLSICQIVEVYGELASSAGRRKSS